jgi:hypothetical protein
MHAEKIIPLCWKEFRRHSTTFVECGAGLPDGLFSRPKIQNLGKFGGPGKCLHVCMTIWYTYFPAIWHILWPFGRVCGHLVYFFHCGIFGPRKIRQP